MTSNQSETTTHPLQEYADSVATAVGGSAEITFDTIKVKVDPENWVATHATARDELDLVYFSFLSAIDWSNDVEVGDPLSEEIEEHFEVLTTLGDLVEGRRVTFSTSLPKENASIPSLVGVYAGANWHEREAGEMFGIVFDGHPNPIHLYLPDGFLGKPLLKSFPLLSREVKPWPGTVDVEGMPDAGADVEDDSPSTENPEA